MIDGEVNDSDNLIVLELVSVRMWRTCMTGEEKVDCDVQKISEIVVDDITIGE